MYGENASTYLHIPFRSLEQRNGLRWFLIGNSDIGSQGKLLTLTELARIICWARHSEGGLRLWVRFWHKFRSEDLYYLRKWLL